MPKRNFTARVPNQKMVSEVTEMRRLMELFTGAAFLYEQTGRLCLYRLLRLLKKTHQHIGYLFTQYL